MSSNAHLRSLTIFLLILSVISFALLHFSNNEADVDLWGNVGFVKSFPWENGFLKVNTFSFTEPNHPWTNHEWLSQYIYNRTFVFFGNTGLLLIKVLLGFSLLALLAFSVIRNCKSMAINFLLLILTISTIGYGFSTRPHLFTYIFLAFMLTGLQKNWFLKTSLIPVWLIIAVLWANAHGAFFIGIVVLFIFSIGFLSNGKNSFYLNQRPALIFAGWALAFILASFINPYGLELWEFVYGSAKRFRPYLSEWAPFNPINDLLTHPDFVFLAGLSIPAIIRPRVINRADRLLLAVSLFAAFFMRRNIPLFAIVSCFVLPQEINALLSGRVDKIINYIKPQFIAVTLFSFIALNFFAAARFNKNSPLQIETPKNKYAVDAIRFLAVNGIKGNALVFFDWGEQFIWHLYPNCKVFMDGRFESAYSPEVIEDYLAFLYSADGWEKALTKYDTDIVLCHIDNNPVRYLRNLKGWRLVYEDNTACIFLKESKHLNSFDKLKYPNDILSIEKVAIFP